MAAKGLLLIVGLFLVIEEGIATDFITPIPTSVEHDKRKALLGKKLFFDKSLSSDGKISCNSCHNLAKYGVDGASKSIGVDRKLGKRNSPTVYNAVLNFTQFWDGRALDLQHQVSGPLLTEFEMGFKNFDDIIKLLSKNAEYKESFDRLYGGEISEETITFSLGEFGKTLLSPNSPFDKYLQGDKSAISEVAKKGYKNFISFGCVGCHQGANVGGNMFQKFGVHADTSLRGAKDDDLGRFNITRNEWDKRVFKVPSLRMAVHSSPYFHDGSVETIEEAIEIMIQYQLGRDVPIDDRDAIVEFLKTLPGELKDGGE